MSSLKASTETTTTNATQTSASSATRRTTAAVAKRILVVDDNQQIRSSIAQFLIHEGYEVETADDGDVGIKKFLQFKPDLIITDIYMPRVPGVHMIQKIRDVFSDVKIIVMSGGSPRGQTVYDVDGEMGVVETLHKPITRKQLIAAVTQCLA